MQIVKCPVCKSKSIEFLDTYISRWNSQEYKLYSCKNCDLQWWEPLEIMPEFYETDVTRQKYHMEIRGVQFYHKPFFHNILQLLPRGRLLDVGCGEGSFLSKVRSYGFEVWGIDLDKKAIETAKNFFGLKNIYATTLDEFIGFCLENNIKFDLITFFEVLEHQDDPIKFIKNISKILKPKGFIIGSVPNRNRLFVNRQRFLSDFDYPPHHFLYFNRKSLCFLLNKCGFDINITYANLNFIQSLDYFGGILYSYILKSNKKEFIYNKDNREQIANKNKASSENSLIMLKHSLFKITKNLRNFSVLPLAIVLYPIYLRKGHVIFFYGMKRKT